MRKSAWLIVGDFGHICGMTAAARKAVDLVKMAVIGPGELAETAAEAGPDELYWFPAGTDNPAEAAAEEAAEMIGKDAPEYLLSLEDAVSRTVWAKAAVKLDAAAVGTFFEISTKGDVRQAKRMIAEDRVVETVETAGILAGIYTGPETEPEGKVSGITQISSTGEDSWVRFAEGVEEAPLTENRLKTAARVVSVGFGVTKSQLEQVEKFAGLIGAEVGCSLPIANQLQWFDEEHVVGVTHNTIAPDLYIALGISGQPQHMSGVRDAKVIVSVNSDPEAPIFRKSKYGIADDLTKILPALLEIAEKHNV